MVCVWQGGPVVPPTPSPLPLPLFVKGPHTYPPAQASPTFCSSPLFLSFSLSPFLSFFLSLTMRLNVRHHTRRSQMPSALLLVRASVETEFWFWHKPERERSLQEPSEGIICTAELSALLLCYEARMDFKAIWDATLSGQWSSVPEANCENLQPRSVFTVRTSHA